MTETKKGLRKNEVAYILAIVLGLAIGILVKKVKIGIIIGAVLCLLIGLSTIFRFTRNK